MAGSSKFGEAWILSATPELVKVGANDLVSVNLRDQSGYLQSGDGIHERGDKYG